MYLGRIVELADKAVLFARPRHPYTRMLLDAIPDIHMSGRARTPVQGEVPNPLASAERLHVPSALPARQRALPRRAAGAADDRRRPRRLPRGRGRPDLAPRAAPSGQQVLAAHQVGDLLAIAHQPGLASADHHLGGARPGVVVAGHAHRVGACRQDGDEVARRDGQAALAAEPVARFAHRADDVPGRGVARGRSRIRRSASRRRTSPAA